MALDLTVADGGKACDKSPAAERIGAELEQEILVGLASPAREMTSADWDEMRRQFERRRIRA